jgi:SAM-dependent methyltransferase
LRQCPVVRGDTAAERWRRLVRDARAALERREAELGLEPMYAGERARSFARLSGVADESDPFLRRVLEHVDASTVVVDAGAGSGRYALALAPAVREVVAVDPSADLLAMLEEQARGRRLANVRAVLARWEDVAPLEADVAISNGVMGHVEDGAVFLRKLDAAARRRVLVGIFVGVDVVRDPLWRHFHGADAPAAPSWLDAVAVLRELGIEPEVEFDDLPESSYADLDEAIYAYRDLLKLPAGADVDRELAAVLSVWLRPDAGGRLQPPFRASPWATVAWTPASATGT